MKRLFDALRWVFNTPTVPVCANVAGVVILGVSSIAAAAALVAWGVFTIALLLHGSVLYGLLLGLLPVVIAVMVIVHAYDVREDK